ncbi:MAG: DCC1-like thiol-disulfide oxidoreductase family protein [Halioglobus sp.]
MDITTKAQLPAATLYYDGRCSICTKEMGRLGRLKTDDLSLVDIHELAADPELPDTETLLRTLHLRKANGTLLTGVDANVTAWSYTRIGPLFKWMQWPLIAPIFSFFYARWARWRYERLYDAACPPRGGSNHAS